MKRTKYNNRNPFGIAESWDIWNIQIEQLKQRNDLLADTDEMPESKNGSGEADSSADNKQR